MKKILGTLFILSVLFTGSFVYAAEGTGSTAPAGSTGSSFNVTQKLENPIKVNTFSELVEKVISAAVQVLMPFVVLYFIYAGFLFVKAQGKPEEIEEAKKAMTYSIIGAFILLGAWGFAQIIGSTVSNITGV